MDDDPDLIAPSALVAPAPFTEDDGGGGGDDDNVVAPPPASMLPDDDGLPEERRERIARGKSASAGHRRKVARNDDYKRLKKRRAAGAIHSLPMESSVMRCNCKQLRIYRLYMNSKHNHACATFNLLPEFQLWFYSIDQGSVLVSL